MTNKKDVPPIKDIWIVRFLLVLCIILALTAVYNWVRFEKLTESLEEQTL